MVMLHSPQIMYLTRDIKTSCTLLGTVALYQRPVVAGGGFFLLLDLGPGAAAGGMGITENITKRWLRQTLVVERGIAVSYKYNPLASVPVPEICVPVLCSRAQKVAVIVIKRKCRLIPDLPAPVAQLFVPGGSVDIMTNFMTDSLPKYTIPIQKFE